MGRFARSHARKALQAGSAIFNKANGAIALTPVASTDGWVASAAAKSLATNGTIRDASTLGSQNDGAISPDVRERVAAVAASVPSPRPSPSSPAMAAAASLRSSSSHRAASLIGHLGVDSSARRHVSIGASIPTRAPPLTLDTINPLVRDCEYAVRGEIVNRALALEAQLALKPGSQPFDEIIYCNIGNPQALGQPAISFYREVLALCDHPHLMTAKDEGGQPLFSATALARASQLLSSIPYGATGAYSHSQGLPFCRQAVADFIARRDGHAASADDIFLTDGASPAVQMVLKLLVRNKSDGVLCPIPQYPLYSASLALNGGTLVPYYLDEAHGWRLDPADLQRVVQRAEGEGVVARALCVINPGNPTGQVMAVEDQQAVVRFCVERGLVLIADEVYQENVYSAGEGSSGGSSSAPAPARGFHSFKKVARDMGVTDRDLALVSCHSASKGFYGECGRRGGYMEVTGLSSEVREAIYKVASVNLCSNVPGQVLMALIAQPPVDGDDAFPKFQAERDAILSSLARRAKLLVDTLNSLEGITCNPLEGAMYAFPRLHLPPRAVEAAAAVGMPADTFYARRLLDATGIVVVPGSGFGQAHGTWHIRFTVLPQEDKIQAMMERFASFHNRFMHEFTM